MTKKTEQHKKYAQLAELLSLKLTPLANRVYANWAKSLVVPQAVPIVMFQP